MNLKIINTLFALTYISAISTAQAGSLNVGINGSACAFDKISVAIDNASSGDTIYIKPGTYNELIGLIKKPLTFVPSEAAAPRNTGCEREMLSADSSTVIVDGAGDGFDNTGGLVQIGNQAIVTFRHMWLRNANADFGGVIGVINGSGLILDDVIVTDGIATQAGGNIMIENGSALSIINGSSVYRGTSSFVGGAVALFDSQMTLDEGRIGVSSNNGFSKAGTHGGGIYADNSEVTFTQTESVLQWNEAGKHGGGLYAVNSIIDIFNSNIANNTAEKSGGGMYLDDTEMNTFNVSIDNNSTTESSANQGGGGMYLTDDSVINVRATRISNNISSNLGGGVLADENTQLNILISSVLSDNVAATSGGGVSTSGNLSLNGSSLINNSAESGGGIHCQSCPAVNIFNDSLIKDNNATAGLGGGLFVDQTTASHLTEITDSQFIDNVSFSTDTSEGYGGGIVIFAGTLSINEDSIVKGNAASQRGGGVYAAKISNESLNIEFNHVVFEENRTTTFQSGFPTGGGGVYVEKADSLTVNNSLFKSNTSEVAGGAVWIIDTDGISINQSEFSLNQSLRYGGIFMVRVSGFIRNSIFKGNESTGGSAGALYLGQSDLAVINGVFSRNQSDFRGAGIYVDSSTLNIEADIGFGAGQCNPFELNFNRYCSQFTGNQSALDGGAIFVENNSEVNIKNTAVVENTASVGTFIYVPESGSGSSINMENLLVADNGSSNGLNSTAEIMGDNEVTMNSITWANNQGSPLLTRANFVALTNSILFDNAVGPEVNLDRPGQLLSISCNNSQAPSNDGLSLGNNLGDPLFMTTPQGDYRLSVASPSVDICNSGPTDDLEGLTRDEGAGLYDQGAFELNGTQLDPDVIFVDGFES